MHANRRILNGYLSMDASSANNSTIPAIAIKTGSALRLSTISASFRLGRRRYRDAAPGPLLGLPKRARLGFDLSGYRLLPRRIALSYAISHP